MGLFSKLFKKKDIELPEEVLKWNKMCELFGDGELEEPFYSLFYYDGEVQNGGHLQFFCNLEESEEPKLKDVLKNLKKLLPEEMYANLDKAYKEYQKLNFNPETSEEYCEVAIEEPLLDYDNFYYEHEEEIQNILKEYSLKLEL